MKLFVGKKVRIGGTKGCVMTITSIDGDDMVLQDNGSTFYYHKGDCALYDVKEYEQLCLFNF